MVEDRLRDGTRIAQLLSSEITGLASLDALRVVDADPDVEPTVDGALAYRVERDGDDFAEVFVHPDRARLEILDDPAREAVVEAAEREELRVRPKAVRPPRTLIFVEDGAQVKRAVRVLESLA